MHRIPKVFRDCGVLEHGTQGAWQPREQYGGRTRQPFVAGEVAEHDGIGARDVFQIPVARRLQFVAGG